MIDINRNKPQQQTLSRSIEISGVGLHSGLEIYLKIEKAPVDNGIKFIRTDSSNNNNIINEFADAIHIGE